MEGNEAVPASPKQALIEELGANGAWAEEALRGLSEAELAQGRYENGWSGRQILAHVAAIEWTYPRLLDLAREAGGTEREANGRVQASARGGMDEYNRRRVEKREGVPVSVLIDEMVRNRAALIDAIEAADDGLFDVPIRSAGGRTGTLAAVMREVAIDHVRGHVNDIVGIRPL
jgi:hypothetical protein